MEELLNHFIEFLLPQSNFFIYLILFLSSVFENLFPPLPGDTVTLFGAFLVGKGRLDFFMVYLITSLGSVVGFMILFYLGSLFSKDYFLKKDLKIFSAKSISQAEKWFKKYGYYVVLLNRFLPGIRSVISLTAGFSKLNKAKVFLFAFISAVAWNFLWIYVGFLTGDNWDVLKEKIGILISGYHKIFFIILIFFVFFFIIKRRKKS